MKNNISISNDNNTWVFCCGMLRSGSTLQYQLASSLIEKLNVGKRARYVPENKFPLLLEEYSNQKGFLSLKCHQLTIPIQTMLNSNHAVSIGIYRDIRDVAVSMMNKWGVSFSELITYERLEKAIEMSEAWMKYPNHMLSKYEELIAEPASEIRKIATHLKLQCDILIVEEIAKEHSLDNQIKRIENIKQKKDSMHIKGEYWGSDSLLHHNHISSGKSGDWKKFLSERQVNILEYKFGDWLLERNYSLSKEINNFYILQKTDQLLSQKKKKNKIKNLYHIKSFQFFSPFRYLIRIIQKTLKFLRIKFII